MTGTSFGHKSTALSLFVAFFAMLLLAAGCRGPEETSVTGETAPGDSPAATTRTSAPSTNKLSAVKYWAYQIQDQEMPGNIRELASSRHDLLVIDQTRSVKEEVDHDSAADVALIKNGAGANGGGKLVICYLDVGQAESYRWYWQDDWRVGEPEWIVADDPDGWDENFPVKYWRPEWREIMQRSLDMIIDDGYDGVYLDWLEAYSFEPVAAAAAAEGLDPRLELEDFVVELAAHARARRPGFIFIAQNAAELGEYPSYVNLFDAIAQEQVWFDGGGDPDSGEVPGDRRMPADESQEYLSNLRLWQELGKPVFNVEYAREPAHVDEAYRMGEENGFKTYVTLRPLESLSSTPPPGY